MRAKLASIKENNTWNLTDLPAGKKPIGLKWVFKLKRDADGNVLKHKACLVAKGYVQRPGIDFKRSLLRWLGWTQCASCLLLPCKRSGRSITWT
jgi:hypothetical protein